MDGSIHGFFLCLTVLLLFVVHFISNVTAKVRLDIGLIRNVSGLHIAVDFIDAHLQDIDIGGEIFLLICHSWQWSYF